MSSKCDLCMSWQKNDIASRNFEDLMHVQVLNGVSCDYYKKPEILSEFEECFKNVVEQDLINRINNSPYLVVMLDETCDISVDDDDDELEFNDASTLLGH